jgi:hypothetical protein
MLFAGLMRLIINVGTTRESTHIAKVKILIPTIPIHGKYTGT